MPNFPTENGRRGQPLLLNQFSAARSRAGAPSAKTLRARAQAVRKAQVDQSLRQIDSVLRRVGVNPATIQKASGKPRAPLGLGELLRARMLKNRLQREGKV